MKSVFWQKTFHNINLITGIASFDKIRSLTLNILALSANVFVIPKLFYTLFILKHTFAIGKACGF